MKQFQVHQRVTSDPLTIGTLGAFCSSTSQDLTPPKSPVSTITCIPRGAQAGEHVW